MIEVKQEADPDGAAEELTPAEMEAMWLQVKQEIKEEMDAEAWPSSAAAPVKKEVASEVTVKQEPVDGAMPKRRRLTGLDLPTSAGGVQHRVAIKKEALDQTEVKQEDEDQCAQHQRELTPEEMETLWLEIKQEIKEEMEAEAAGVGQAADVSRAWVKTEVADEVKTEVKIKRELPEEGNQDGSLHDSQNTQPADPATPKRRRLTRRDLETPAKQAMDTAPGKQELSNQVRIKKEVKTERALQEGRKLTPSERDGLPLEVKQEISEETTSDIKQEVMGVGESSAAAGITVKKELLGDDSAGRSDMLDAFVAQAAAWAKQCIIFRSSRTWTPTRHELGFRDNPMSYSVVRAELSNKVSSRTNPSSRLELCRPCCPANFFLEMEDGMPKAPAADAPPCVQCLSARGLRCWQRFHAKHGQQAGMLFEEAGSQCVVPVLCGVARLGARAGTAPGAAAFKTPGSCEHCPRGAQGSCTASICHPRLRTERLAQ